MKTAKGIILIICGMVIAFFPQIISFMCYAAGGFIAVSAIIGFIGILFSGQLDGMMISGTITGVLIGGGIMLLPRFTELLIPLTAGIIFGAIGIDFGIKSLNKQKAKGVRITGAVLAAIFITVSCLLIFHAFTAGKIARIIIGIVMILVGVFHLFSGRNKNTSETESDSNIIDIDSYSVK